jgi:hypothetical protein
MTYFGLALGAMFGAALAAKRKGKLLDMLQYGAACRHYRRAFGVDCQYRYPAHGLADVFALLRSP